MKSGNGFVILFGSAPFYFGDSSGQFWCLWRDEIFSNSQRWTPNVGNLHIFICHCCIMCGAFGTSNFAYIVLARIYGTRANECRQTLLKIVLNHFFIELPNRKGQQQNGTNSRRNIIICDETESPKGIGVHFISLEMKLTLLVAINWCLCRTLTALKNAIAAYATYHFDQSSDHFFFLLSLCFFCFLAHSLPFSFSFFVFVPNTHALTFVSLYLLLHFRFFFLEFRPQGCIRLTIIFLLCIRL